MCIGINVSWKIHEKGKIAITRHAQNSRALFESNWLEKERLVPTANVFSSRAISIGVDIKVSSNGQISI